MSVLLRERALEPTPVGIDRIGVHPTTLAVGMEALVRDRGGDVDGTCGEMMIRERSLNPPWEDPVTMGVNAVRALLSEEERDGVGLLVVASESGPDQEKSLSTWIQRYAGLPDSCRNVEIKHACYAGTAAVHLACQWLASHGPDARALVVTTDESRTHFRRPYEFVMGAGAVAMLLSHDPGFLAYDHGVAGVYTHEVSDLTRPTSRVEAGHSETSLLSYLDAVDITFQRYAAALEARTGRRLDSFDAFADWLPNLVFHAPFGGITARAHRAVLRLFDDYDPALARSDFESRVAPGLRHNVRMGGTYGSSVFVSLLGLVDALGEQTGRRVGVYSYGSGSCAEYSSGVFGPRTGEEAARANVAGLLDARKSLSVGQYEEAEEERCRRIDAEDVDVALDGLDGWYDERYRGRGLLTFTGIRNHVRQYAWS